MRVKKITYESNLQNVAPTVVAMHNRNFIIRKSTNDAQPIRNLLILFYISKSELHKKNQFVTEDADKT